MWNSTIGVKSVLCVYNNADSMTHTDTAVRLSLEHWHKLHPQFPYPWIPSPQVLGPVSPVFILSSLNHWFVMTWISSRGVISYDLVLCHACAVKLHCSYWYTGANLSEPHTMVSWMVAMWYMYSVSLDTYVLIVFAFSFLCVSPNSAMLLKASYKAAVCSLVESFLALATWIL